MAASSAGEMMASALYYAKLGRCVIPLDGKRPFFENWPDVATANTDIIRRWWSTYPNANIGVATGRRMGIFVMDVDAKKGGLETYDELVFKHGQFPNTWQQKTGGGGIQLFFRYPAFRVQNQVDVFPGIDIRGDGGQVVVPPSIHPETGQRYVWDGADQLSKTPIAEAPGWLLETLQGAPNAQKPAFGTPEAIPTGMRNSTLTSLAGSLRRIGLTEAEMVPALMEVNRRRCQESLPQGDIETIAHSMMRYQPSDNDLFRTAGTVWRMAKKTELEQQQAMAAIQIEPKNGLEVYRSTTAAPQSVIANLLTVGLTILAGKSKEGKSWMALQAALSVAEGSKFMGWADVESPGGVIVYSLEMGENRNASRMRKLRDAEDIRFQNIDFVWKSAPMASGGLEQLDTMISQKRPNLVIIDTFLAFMGGDTGNSGDVMRAQYQEINKLKQVADKNATAILLVHHTRKAGALETGDAGIDLIAGSRGITAACDCVWILRKTADGFCMDVLGRDVEQQQLALRFEQEPFGWQAVGDAEEVAQESKQNEVLRWLEKGPNTVANLISLTNIPKKKLLEVIDGLQKLGIINQNPSSGTYYVVPEIYR